MRSWSRLKGICKHWPVSSVFNRYHMGKHAHIVLSVECRISFCWWPFGLCQAGLPAEWWRWQGRLPRAGCPMRWVRGEAPKRSSTQLGLNKPWNCEIFLGYLSFTPSQVKLWSQQTSSHRDCSGTARGLGWPCTQSTLVSDGFQLSAIQVLNSSTEILPTVTMLVLESCLPPGMCKDAPKWPELHVTQSWRGCWMFQWPCA